MEKSAEPKPGHYRHYKGGHYTVVGVARHSETEEWLVVYRPEYGDGGLWVRPLSMFQEQVIVDGQPQPRFAYIGEATTLSDSARNGSSNTDSR